MHHEVVVLKTDGSLLAKLSQVCFFSYDSGGITASYVLSIGSQHHRLVTSCCNYVLYNKVFFVTPYANIIVLNYKTELCVVVLVHLHHCKIYSSSDVLILFR